MRFGEFGMVNGSNGEARMSESGADDFAEGEGVDGQAPEVADNTPPSAGAQLRMARIAKGMSIEQVSAQTRITERHLESLEEGNYDALPSRTYSIGFAKNFARAVGLDRDTIGQTVKWELDQHEAPTRPERTYLEPGDPSRVPSRRLGWFAALALVLLAAGIIAYLSRSTGYAELEPVGSEEAEQEAVAAADPQAAPSAAPTGGPVVFTATREVWVRFYEPGGERLFEDTMAEGDTYTIPADAENPQINTGRPDGFKITIGGREVPRLREEMETISDVPVGAEALLARTANGSTRAAASPATSQ